MGEGKKKKVYHVINVNTTINPLLIIHQAIRQKYFILSVSNVQFGDIIIESKRYISGEWRVEKGEIREGRVFDFPSNR